MRYEIVGTEEIFDTIDEALDYCIEEDYYENDDYFEEWVNDNWSEARCTICGYTFEPYEIAKIEDYCIDELLRDFKESMNERDRQEAEYDLRYAGIGYETNVQNYTIRVIEDENEDEEVFDEPSEDLLEQCRKRIEERISEIEAVQNNEKQTEDDIMSLFQILR